MVENIGIQGSDSLDTSGMMKFMVGIMGVAIMGSIASSMLVSAEPVPSPTTVPVAPTLVSPANGGSASGPSVVFTWLASVGATSYWLQLTTDPSFAGTDIINADVGNITQCITSGLPANGTTLYWRVYALNAIGMSAASQEWSFVNSVPSGRTPIDIIWS